MNYIDHKYPLFLGLSHIGQIYSIGWAKKIGECAVFDFNKKNLNLFVNKKYSHEEWNLNSVKYNPKKIKIYHDEEKILNHSVIFFTYDTPIDINGKPNLQYIENYFKILSKIKFLKKTKIIFTSQVFPGFSEFLRKKYLKKNRMIDLIYMVDTLKMGNAIERFLYPEQLVFGGSPKNKKFILNFFRKFKCKKYLYRTTEAEMVKVSINLFLYFSVNFSNILDEFSKKIGMNFSKVISSLKNDKRIGYNSYIHPSISISGGHLERDAYFVNKYSNNKFINNIFKNLENLNKNRRLMLRKLVENLLRKNKNKVLIVGISYKEKSFSIINSIFKDILRSKKLDVRYYDSYYKKMNLSIKEVSKLNISSLEADLILYNYSTIEDLNKIKKFAIKKKIFLINLSHNNKKLFNKKKIINYFSSELSNLW